MAAAEAAVEAETAVAAAVGAEAAVGAAAEATAVITKGYKMLLSINNQVYCVINIWKRKKNVS